MEAKNSALLSSCDGYVLEPIEWPKGSQASCGVLLEDSGFVCTPCWQRSALSHDEGESSWVFFFFAAGRVGFSLRNDGELKEPLVWPQGSSVSIQVAKRSMALLSSRGRGIGPQDALKGEYRGLSGAAAGNPGFPRHVTVTSATFSGCLWGVRNIVELEGPPGTPLG